MKFQYRLVGMLFVLACLVGCETHSPKQRVFSNWPINEPEPTVDPTDPTDPALETRPDLTIVLHATVSDNSATDAIVQLDWDVTFAGVAQTVHGLSLSITKDGVGYTAETLADTDFTVPSVYNGPNNPAHLSSAVRLPVGVYTFVATVDSMHSITESNESNNTSTITVEVMPNGAG